MTTLSRLFDSVAWESLMTEPESVRFGGVGWFNAIPCGNVSVDARCADGAEPGELRDFGHAGVATRCRIAFDRDGAGYCASAGVVGLEHAVTQWRTGGVDGDGVRDRYARAHPHAKNSRAARIDEQSV